MGEYGRRIKIRCCLFILNSSHQNRQRCTKKKSTILPGCGFVSHMHVPCNVTSVIGVSKLFSTSQKRFKWWRPSPDNGELDCSVQRGRSACTFSYASYTLITQSASAAFICFFTLYIPLFYLINLSFRQYAVSSLTHLFLQQSFMYTFALLTKDRSYIARLSIVFLSFVDHSLRHR